MNSLAAAAAAAGPRVSALALVALLRHQPSRRLAYYAALAAVAKIVILHLLRAGSSKLHAALTAEREEVAQALRALREQSSEFEYALKRAAEEHAALQGAEAARAVEAETRQQELQKVAKELEEFEGTSSNPQLSLSQVKLFSIAGVALLSYEKMQM